MKVFFTDHFVDDFIHQSQVLVRDVVFEYLCATALDASLIAQAALPELKSTVAASPINHGNHLFPNVICYKSPSKSTGISSVSCSTRSSTIHVAEGVV